MGGIFNRRLLLIIVLLGVAAAAGWWLRERIHNLEPDRQARTTPTAPDYYMEHFTVRAMNTQGRLRYTLSADDMKHYAEDDHADLSRPHAVFERPDGPPYVLDAERGRITSGGERVDLLGRVDIDRSGTDTLRPLHVITRDARVFPDRDYAESDQFTVIRSGTSQMQGTGVRAWFDERRLQLLSQVEGTYEPQKR